LPRLQKFINQYKNRSDVQFLTLSIDQNPGLIEPFVQDHKFTFPVLPAYSYASDTLKVFGIPQNWIVDPNGVVRLKGEGYDAGGKWDKGMANAIEKYAPRKPASPPSQGSGR
jgi:hypothetical protein